MDRRPMVSIDQAEHGYIVTPGRFRMDYPTVYAFSTLAEAISFVLTYFTDQESEKPNTE